MPIKVFIVEDESDLLDYYVEAVELSGHIVVGLARNGAEAVERFGKLCERPDIVIMDHRMPVKNGIEAAREIIAVVPGARIIFASADVSVEAEARSLGVVSFKKKPFSFDRLIENIEKHA